ncbi:MAG: hypothetical protein AVDCRST_MAG45-371, partial [uncultured Solirubrobacterales bacterium]
GPARLLPPVRGHRRGGDQPRAARAPPPRAGGCPRAGAGARPREHRMAGPPERRGGQRLDLRSPGPGQRLPRPAGQPAPAPLGRPPRGGARAGRGRQRRGGAAPDRGPRPAGARRRAGHAVALVSALPADGPAGGRAGGGRRPGGRADRPRGDPRRGDRAHPRGDDLQSQRPHRHLPGVGAVGRAAVGAARACPRAARRGLRPLPGRRGARRRPRARRRVSATARATDLLEGLRAVGAAHGLRRRLDPSRRRARGSVPHARSQRPQPGRGRAGAQDRRRRGRAPTGPCHRRTQPAAGCAGGHGGRRAEQPGELRLAAGGAAQRCGPRGSARGGPCARGARRPVRRRRPRARGYPRRRGDGAAAGGAGGERGAV